MAPHRISPLPPPPHLPLPPQGKGAEREGEGSAEAPCVTAAAVWIWPQAPSSCAGRSQAPAMAVVDLPRVDVPHRAPTQARGRAPAAAGWPRVDLPATGERKGEEGRGEEMGNEREEKE